MISTLRKNGDVFRCSNCMMRQPHPLKSNCPYCGNMFSNYEDIIINEKIEQQAGEVSEQRDILPQL